MKRTAVALLGLGMAAAAAVHAQDGPLDTLDEALSLSGFQDAWRLHLSGTAEVEGYVFPAPAPGLIAASGDSLFAPRVTLFADAQAGDHVYFFAQTRLDRGFDPGPGGLRFRADEYALRIIPGDGRRFSLQAGKFATVVGNWTARHDSWANPFITAPLPYENLTGIWDAAAARTGQTLLSWAHLRPFPPADLDAAKKLRLPIIWGPSYAAGASASGAVGGFSYAVEVKNTGLSSRPETWQPTQTTWEHPAYSGRIAFRPNELWFFGVSASEGPYLRDSAARTVPAGRSFDAYRETVFGQDVLLAWHHFQAWAEVFEARFAVPGVANADVLSYYLEAKYKFTPQLFGAVRWNQQIYGEIPVAGLMTSWGADAWRLDVAPTYRITAHVQTKLQYSLQHGNAPSRPLGHTLAAQATLRF
jgi:hypothetical protein